MDEYYEDEYSDWDLDTVDLHFVSGNSITIPAALRSRSHTATEVIISDYSFYRYSA